MKNKVTRTHVNNVKDAFRRSDKSIVIVKSLVVTLLLLVIFSASILVIRIGKVLPNNVDIFFIEPKIGNVEFSDDEQIWGMDTQISIFETSYSDENGNVVVKSNGGNNVIAPGLEGSYEFQIKNLGNIAVDAETEVNIGVEIHSLDYTNLPIEFRFIDYQGNNLLGDGWVSADKIGDCVSNFTVGNNSYIYYILDWRWAFESGKDEFDTLLGNFTIDSMIKLTVNIAAKAIQSENIDAKGGLPLSDDDPRNGGDIVPMPYIMLNLLILIINIVLIKRYIEKRKKKSEEISKYLHNNEPHIYE